MLWLVKFKQNCMVQTTRNFELFDKNPGFINHLQQSFGAILADPNYIKDKKWFSISKKIEKKVNLRGRNWMLLAHMP